MLYPNFMLLFAYTACIARTSLKPQSKKEFLFTLRLNVFGSCITDTILSLGQWISYYSAQFQLSVESMLFIWDMDCDKYTVNSECIEMHWVSANKHCTRNESISSVTKIRQNMNWHRYLFWPCPILKSPCMLSLNDTLSTSSSHVFFTKHIQIGRL